MTNTYRLTANRKHIGTRQKLIGIILGGMIVSLGVYYLILTNTIVAQGYQVNELNTKVRNLKTTTQKLQADTAEQQSLNILQNYLAKDHFVVANTIEYLDDKSSNNGVALK